MARDPALVLAARAELELRRRRGASERQRKHERARTISLADYAREAWPTLEPATPLVWGRHLDAICLHLEAVTDGRIKRLMINIPPGHMKSLLVSVIWPSWMWLARPSLRMLAATYAQDLTLRDAIRMRDLVTSDWYRDEFAPEWEIRPDLSAKSRFVTTQSGERFSVSTGSKVTGFRGDGIIIDDPLNARDAMGTSDTRLDEADMFVRRILPTRLNDPVRGWMVLVMQRLHERDPCGSLLRSGQWVHLCLPSEFDPERRCTTEIGWSDWRTDPDEPLFPAMYPSWRLDELKDADGGIGPRAFAGQHNQRPAPAGGAIFRRDWCGRRHAEPPTSPDETWQSWDFSFGGKGSANSYVVGQVWAREGSTRYLLDQFRSRVAFPRMIEAMREMSAKWPQATRKLVEDAALGRAVIDTLRHELDGVIPIRPDGPKESRASAVTGLWEAGNVSLPAASWVDAFIEEIVTFPAGVNDDQVDAMTMALRYTLRDHDAPALAYAGRAGVDVQGADWFSSRPNVW